MDFGTDVEDSLEERMGYFFFYYSTQTKSPAIASLEINMLGNLVLLKEKYLFTRRKCSCSHPLNKKVICRPPSR